MKTTELTTNPPASEALGMEASALKDRDGVCMWGTADIDIHQGADVHSDVQATQQRDTRKMSL